MAASKEVRVPAVLHAIKVLRCLASADRPLSASSIAKSTGISASTCFNILRTLASEDLLDIDEEGKTYALGLGILEFASPLMQRERHALVRMVLSRVASAHGVALTVWQVNANDRLVLMDVMRANATVQIDIRLGARLPILAGAIGRSVAAVMQLSDEDLRRHFAEVRWRAPPAFKDFKSDVEQARRDGYALDLGNWYPAVHAAASAVVDSSGRPTLCIGGLALAGQRSLDEMRELGVSLREAARVIGRSLRASLQDDVPA